MIIEGQCHYLTFAQGQLHIKITVAFLSNHRLNFECKLVGTRKMKIHQDNAGHMTKMAAMLKYGKNTFKIFFPLG